MTNLISRITDIHLIIVAEREKPNRRRRYGRLLAIAGGILTGTSIIFTLLVSFAAAFAGSSYIYSTFSGYAFYPFLAGICMSFVGLLAWLLPEGPSSLFFWTAKTGGYAGTN
ncbi:MAG: hypothetical protein JSW61_09055 [Candidatus Thorarchaeota archaeon]|nr:MAG: hypothetical protein JSW61_09055 [Candidatus Thorarchaeota archaeon]